MKVLIFSLAYFPKVGGAEIAIDEITKRIDDIEFHLVTLRFGKERRTEQLGNVTVHRVGWGPSYFAKILFVPLAALKAARLNRTLKFDGFWAMMSYMTFPIALMRLFGNKTPYLLTLQDGDPFERVFERPHIKPFLPLLRYGFKNATLVQTLSTYLVDWAHTLGYEGAVEVVPNGVDAKHFSRIVGSREEMRRSWQQHMSDVLLVSTSRAVTKNALDDVIRALKFLPSHVHFFNFGYGPDIVKLENLARSLGVLDRTHLMPHPGLETLPQYLQACDIFIRPSRSEGFGISFVEAMAAGLPVIATTEGGLSDFIFDKKTAFVVDRDSPKQIAEAVEYILSNPELSKKVIETARSMVFEKYDWQLIAKTMREKVFSRLFA
ncbi:glycosyltransferase family 4 protein [Candidatus Parcubacteria bacterium]|nr:glycosyltransferase family 4 protein [Candidatus Parcubacteria bacterium]